MEKRDKGNAVIVDEARQRPFEGDDSEQGVGDEEYDREDPRDEPRELHEAAIPSWGAHGGAPRVKTSFSLTSRAQTPQNSREKH